jgi:hypothetical protein
MSTVTKRTVTVAKRRFELSREIVERTMGGVLAEPIASLFVVIDDRRFPPKQVVSAVTGVDRADFTSHQARRILTGLGFAAGRVSEEEGADDVNTGAGPSNGEGGRSRPSAEALEPFVGQWVATRGPNVLVAAQDPRTVVRWLAEHGQQAESMFRVPEDEDQASGLAPR